VKLSLLLHTSTYPPPQEVVRELGSLPINLKGTEPQRLLDLYQLEEVTVFVY